MAYVKLSSEKYLLEAQKNEPKENKRAKYFYSLAVHFMFGCLAAITMLIAFETMPMWMPYVQIYLK